MVSWVNCCARSHTTGRNKCCDKCNCDERRVAMRVYQAKWRKARKEKAAKMGQLSAVPDIPARPAAPKSTTVKTQFPLGIIGESALLEIAKIDGATERSPLIVAMIMRLASDIDRGEVAQLSSAVNTIQRMMNELRAQTPAAAGSGPAAVSPAERFWSEFEQAGS